MSALDRSLFKVLFLAFVATTVATTIAACSSSDTIVAVTVSSSANVGAVSKLVITVTPKAGSATMAEFVPPSVDGAILPSFFERVKIPSGISGAATVRVDALDQAGVSFAWGAADTNIISGGATTALVKVSRTGSMMPDGGVDGSVDIGSDTNATVDAPTADGADTAAASLDGGADG
jgi:hypothetical protein